MTNKWPALVVTSGPQAGQRFTVRADPASVGRSADADIRVESYNVSRQHLRVSRQGAELLVQDLGSSNGTYVNGARLAGVGVLKPGDTLRVADAELQYVGLGSPTKAGSAPS
jgi:pSer/pThr/pTyr-binding forkhead associated (FHA) protein